MVMRDCVEAGRLHDEQSRPARASSLVKHPLPHPEMLDFDGLSYQ